MQRRSERQLKRSIKRGMVAFEEACGDPDRRSLVDKTPAKRDLIGGEFWGTSEPDPSSLSRDAPGAGALMNQGALELGNASEHRQNHATRR